MASTLMFTNLLTTSPVTCMERNVSTVSLSLMIPSHVAEDAPRFRVAGTGDNPMFCLADVCKALGIGNPRDRTASLDDDEKGVGFADTPGGPQQMTFVTEPGLLRLLVTTRQKEGDSPEVIARNARIKAFQRWVFHEVLPSIRRHGCYPPPPQEEDVIVRACMESSRALMMVAETRKAQLELQARQSALEEQSARALSTAKAALDTAAGNFGYVSVLGYLKLQGREVTSAEASQHGRKLSAMCRNRDLSIQEIRDGRFGKVNLYPESLLADYFGPIHGRDC